MSLDLKYHISVFSCPAHCHPFHLLYLQHSHVAIHCTSFTADNKMNSQTDRPFFKMGVNNKQTAYKHKICSHVIHLLKLQPSVIPSFQNLTL